MTTATPLPAGTWTLDPSATTITATAKMFGLIPVPATVDLTNGTIVVGDESRIDSVEIVADASTYTSGTEKRDVHVRSDDFLDADQHREIVFRTADPFPGSGGDVAGSLTIKGSSVPLRITATDLDVDARRGTFRATAVVDRKAVGVDKMPSFVIGRTISVDVTAAATLAA